MDLYSTVSQLMFEHQIASDIAIAGIVVGTIILVKQHQYNKRRRIYRYLRGILMSRGDRRKLQMMRFEDALGDAALDMLFRGEMTPDQEREWCELFAEHYGFVGLVPMKDVKRGIRSRLKHFYPKLNLRFPVERKETKKKEGLSNSRYAKK